MPSQALKTSLLFASKPTWTWSAVPMMVQCTTSPKTNYKYKTNEICTYKGQLFIDGDWLKAKNTTLGADDGIGVAACLALLSDPNAQHGPIEALFTGTTDFWRSLLT